MQEGQGFKYLLSIINSGKANFGELFSRDIFLKVRPERRARGAEASGNTIEVCKLKRGFEQNLKFTVLLPQSHRTTL